MSAFPDQLRLGCAVTSIERTPHGVVVHDSHGRNDTYDHVVIASHSDQALKMLSDATVASARFSAPSAMRQYGLSASRHRIDAEAQAGLASWNFLRWQREGAADNDVAVTIG